MTLPLVLAIAGCIALLVGLVGGGIKAKEIEVPKIPVTSRLISSFFGVALIAGAIQLQLNATDPKPSTGPPTSTPISVTELAAEPSQVARLNILSFYNQYYHAEDEYPGTTVDTPHRFRTSGKADFVIDYKKHVWMAICPQTTKKCTVKQLTLDASGKWNTFIDIASAGADCAIIDLVFVIVDAQVHENLKDIDEASGISQTKFEEKRFEAYIPFAARPVLDESNQLTAICQTASR